MFVLIDPMAQEGPERPAFRRATSFSGYGEGWGLYSEWLGTQMGIYETPYEDMGRLGQGDFDVIALSGRQR